MRATTLAIAATAVLLLTGCSAAEDAAQGASDQAQSQATEIAVDAARKQACDAAEKIVADGKISPSERAQIKVAVDAAESAGISPDVTTALRKVLESGAELPAGASKAVEDACATP